MSQERIPTTNIKAEEVKEDSFENQFKKREHWKVAGGTAEVVDLEPENPETKDKVPMLFAPAWACDLDVYEPTLREIFNQGHRVISLNHPRTGGDMNKALEELGLKLKDFPMLPNTPEQIRKALNILGILEKKNIKKVDAVAHSEGALNTIIAAMLEPERFRNIILFAPAGLIGEDTLPRLAKGFAGQGKRAESMEHVAVTEDERLVGARARASVLGYVTNNPLRAFGEISDLSRTQIHEMLHYLREKGINIVVMATIDDPVFPMEKMQETITPDMVDGFLSLAGAHGEIGNHPELFVPIIIKTLETLEENRRKEVKREGI